MGVEIDRANRRNDLKAKKAGLQALINRKNSPEFQQELAAYHAGREAELADLRQRYSSLDAQELAMFESVTAQNSPETALDQQIRAAQEQVNQAQQATSQDPPAPGFFAKLGQRVSNLFRGNGLRTDLEVEQHQEKLAQQEAARIEKMNSPYGAVNNENIQEVVKDLQAQHEQAKASIQAHIDAQKAEIAGYEAQLKAAKAEYIQQKVDAYVAENPGDLFGKLEAQAAAQADADEMYKFSPEVQERIEYLKGEIKDQEEVLAPGSGYQLAPENAPVAPYVPAVAQVPPPDGSAMSVGSAEYSKAERERDSIFMNAAEKLKRGESLSERERAIYESHRDENGKVQIYERYDADERLEQQAAMADQPYVTITPSELTETEHPEDDLNSDYNSSYTLS